jgi:hypothetical protein
VFLGLLLAASCSSESRTAFRLTVSFDAALSLDQLRVEAAPQGAPGDAAPPAPQLVPDSPAALHPGLTLVLLVPDAWVGETVDITVIGLSAGSEVARGQVSGVVKLHEVVELEVSLTAPCVSACTPGETRCEKGQLRFCQTDAQGCARFSASEPCPSTKPLCSGDVCAEKCGDQCTSGERRCRDAGYQVCGKSDAGCLDWGPVLGCGAGETCRASDGQCILDCGGKPCACKPADTQTCTNVGECKGGVRNCTNGEFGACEWQVGPMAEVCDGKDNDCSGTPDDNLVAPACDQQQGVCQGAVKKCGGASGWLACTDSDYSAWAQSKGLAYEAAETKCDGKDNDCNGKTDEPSGCCQPSCGTRKCGPDPVCGQSCGSCTAPATCDSSGQCTSAALGWSKRFGDADHDWGNSVAVDASGNVYVTGTFIGAVDFGSGSLQSAGAYDVFVASFAPSGAPGWSKRFGGGGYDFGKSVVVDASGNVCVTGTFEGAVDFGSGSLQSAGGDDLFVASFAPGGAPRWSKRFGGAHNDEGKAVAIDGIGNVYVTGSFDDTVDFGNGPLQSAGAQDIFLASFTSSSLPRWSKRFGIVGSDIGSSAAVDGSGNVHVTGYVTGAVDFGNGPLPYADWGDIFLASFTPSGTPLWSKSLGGAGYDQGSSVALDATGNVYVTGNFEGAVDFGTGSLQSAGARDVFVASFTPSGTPRWSKRFGGTGDDYASSVAVDGSGNVYVTGRFEGAVDFGTGSLQSAGAGDVFVASFTPSGTPRWSKRFGSTGDDYASSIAVDGAGKVYLTGSFQGTVDFGHGPLQSHGVEDIFLLQLVP